jgi:NAD(P)-dependent dehydrogenase (short-subunit alcohol dehydrogenase family)
VTDWKQLEQAFDACIREFGSVDIVGPGAGVFEPPFSNFWKPPGSQGSKDALDANSYQTMDINVTHPIRATQMAIAEFLTPRDTKRERASPSNPKRVVLTSSIAGQVHGLATPLYFASKHAISGFTRSLGDLDETLGIRVNGNKMFKLAMFSSLLIQYSRGSGCSEDTTVD